MAVNRLGLFLFQTWDGAFQFNISHITNLNLFVTHPPIAWIRVQRELPAIAQR